MKPDDPVTAYARAVRDGTVIAGRLATLACLRHLDDLERAAVKGLEWRPSDAVEAIDFFAEILCLPEESAAGETATDAAPEDGTPFILSPWQQFIVGSLMGWYQETGYQRFLLAYIEGSKGCGKTPMGAGLLLYLLVVRADRGAQLFVAAVGKEQAKIAFADAEKMVDASPALRALIDKRVNNLSIHETGSFLRAISSEKRGLDGKRVSGALIDELHEHATAVVANKIRKGTKGRKNSLIIETTNSGYNRTTVCWAHREYSQKVLEGTIVDETWFAYICGLDPCSACLAKGRQFPSEECPDCDDWKTEGPHWLKANPNLGVSLPWRYLRDLVTQALGMPSAVSDLLRFNFCIWTQAIDRFIDMGQWHACPPAPSTAAARCYAGLDLGQSDDFCAFVLLWVTDDGRVVVKPTFWIPRKALERFPNRPYEEWQRAGVLIITDGDETDYGLVQEFILAACREHAVLECGFDKKFSHQMAQNLTASGVTMVDTPQGFPLNEALRKLANLLALGQLSHGSHPVLSWMASNAVVRHGPNKTIRLDKETAADKIDGLVALVMAIDRGIVRVPVTAPSVYRTRGVLDLADFLP